VKFREIFYHFDYGIFFFNVCPLNRAETPTKIVKKMITNFILDTQVLKILPYIAIFYYVKRINSLQHLLLR